MHSTSPGRNPLFCCGASGCAESDTPLCLLASSPHPRVLQVLSRLTLEPHTPNPTICYPHISSMFVTTEGGVYGWGSYLGIIPVATQLLVHSGESVCPCVHACYLLRVCVPIGSVCSYMAICVMPPREEL